MGRIKTLEICNFKSYFGHHVLGPFDSNFTAVVGPNGAGKSNFMDAISFVLGVQAFELRHKKLSDLIYHREEEGRERPTEASVSLVFQTGDDSEDAVDGEVVFSRHVTLAGGSSYNVNGGSVNRDEYVAALERLSILVKAKNFLVFQGDVASIADKTPTELAHFFEQVSGSDRFKNEYDELKTQTGAAERRLEDEVQKRKVIAQEKKIVEKQKREAEDFSRKAEQLSAQQQQLVLWKLHHAKHWLEQAASAHKAAEKKRGALQDDVDRAQEEVQKLSKEVGKKKKRALDAGSKAKEQATKHRALQREHDTLRKEAEATRKDLQNDEKFKQRLEQKVEEQEVGRCGWLGGQ
jgi:structural maintenance of chromosome 1